MSLAFSRSVGCNGTKTKLTRELVQDHHAGIKGVCNRAIEVKNHQLRRTGGSSPASPAPQPATTKDIPSESSHVVTSSSFNSIVPLNFGSSGDSPKLADTKEATLVHFVGCKAGLSGASANSRSCCGIVDIRQHGGDPIIREEPKNGRLPERSPPAAFQEISIVRPSLRH